MWERVTNSKNNYSVVLNFPKNIVGQYSDENKIPEIPKNISHTILRKFFESVWVS